MKSGRAAVPGLRPGLVVRDEIRGRDYRIETLLGQGGFGTAYLARRSGGKLCVLKVTINAAAWHREAYFGHLLRHVPALVEVYDSFAWVPAGRTPLYCLVSEYMERGDLNGYLERHPQAWP